MTVNPSVGAHDTAVKWGWEDRDKNSDSFQLLVLVFQHSQECLY